MIYYLWHKKAIVHKNEQELCLSACVSSIVGGGRTVLRSHLQLRSHGTFGCLVHGPIFLGYSMCPCPSEWSYTHYVCGQHQLDLIGD